MVLLGQWWAEDQLPQKPWRAVAARTNAVRGKCRIDGKNHRPHKGSAEEAGELTAFFSVGVVPFASSGSSGLPFAFA
jgi:hypothetical protein